MSRNQILVRSLQAVAFLGTLFWSIASRYFVSGATLYLTTIAAMIVSAITSYLLFKSEPVQTWVRTPVVLLSLCLFNVVAALGVLLIVPGRSGVFGGIALGVVGIGAGVRFAMLRRARSTSTPHAAGSTPLR